LVDVALQTRESAGLGLEVAVDPAGAAGQLDELVPFDRSLTLDRLLRLRDLLVDPAQGAGRPVGPVLVEDRPVPLVGLRANHRGLDEHLPVRDRLTGMGLPPQYKRLFGQY
jgi:hypothetical protein